MNIKKLNEKLIELLENREWVYEPICKIEQILHELKQAEIKDWKQQINIEEAVDKLHEYYLQGKTRVGFPTNTSFSYKGNIYHLALVIGNVISKNGQLYCKFGYKHIFDKHGKETKIIDKGTLTSENSLKNAIKNIEVAIDKGKPYISKNNPDRLAILYKGLLYIICFSSDPNYVTYLHTLFPPSKDYKKNSFKKQYEPTTSVTVLKSKDDSIESS